MKKQTLTATTSVGIFTRDTLSAYTHVVVWNSPRALNTVTAYKAEGRKFSGVDARWNKDHGYGVTWHCSEASARKATKFYSWDRKAATLVGVFPVDAQS